MHPPSRVTRRSQLATLYTAAMVMTGRHVPSLSAELLWLVRLFLVPGTAFVDVYCTLMWAGAYMFTGRYGSLMRIGVHDFSQHMKPLPSPRPQSHRRPCLSMDWMRCYSVPKCGCICRPPWWHTCYLRLRCVCCCVFHVFVYSVHNCTYFVVITECGGWVCGQRR